MAAYNWVTLETPCPNCGKRALLAQTHLCSSFRGTEEEGSLCMETYRIGDTMRWPDVWPEHPYGHPAAQNVTDSSAEEICYADCIECKHEYDVLIHVEGSRLVSERLIGPTPPPYDPALLRRYWFDLEPTGDDWFDLGCGVTAESEQDAVVMLQVRFLMYGERLVRRTIVDVDVTSLDPERVLPYIGPVDERGVWFPPFVPPSRVG